MINSVRINDVAPWIQHLGDGIATTFVFPFAIFKATDLEVWINDALVSEGYNVSLAEGSGGVAHFLTPPDQGARVTLRRRLKLARSSSFQADGVIRAKALNDEFDYQVAALQQVAHDVERSVKRSPASPTLADLTLPEPQAGAILAWRDDAKALVNKTVVPDANVAVVFGETGRNVAEAGTPAQARAVLELGSAASEDVAAFAQLDDTGFIPEAALPPVIERRLAFLERNLAINTLRDQIDSGWSVLKMVNGIADEFEDEAGVSVTTVSTVDVVPKMTGYNAPSGIVTTENDASGAAWKAFDDTAGDSYVWYSAVIPNWVAYDFGSGAGKVLCGYSIKMSPSYGAYGPKSWTFEGWDAAAGAWVVLDARVNQIQWFNSERRVYEFENVTSFEKFRLNVSARHNGSYLIIEEVEFFDRRAVGDNVGMTYDAAGDFYTNMQAGPGDIVPTMTADSQNGHVASCSFYYNYSPYNLFNDTPTTDYWYTYGAALPQWIKIQLPMPRRVRRLVLTTYPGNQGYMPKDFQLQGSNDGTLWTTILSVTGCTAWLSAERRQWPIINPTAYSQYRLYVTATNSTTGYVLIADMELHEHAPPADGRLVSVPYVAEAVPDEGRMVILHQPVDPTDLDADVVAEVSRDDGANWAACPLLNVGPFDATTVVLAGIADLGGQPQGMAMRWRIRTLNNKEQRIHGVWMQWR